LEETDIQELLASHAAELSEKDFEHLTVLSEPDDKDYCFCGGLYLLPIL
jgi:hypothetical protein